MNKLYLVECEYIIISPSGMVPVYLFYKVFFLSSLTDIWARNKNRINSAATSTRIEL